MVQDIAVQPCIARDRRWYISEDGESAAPTAQLTNDFLANMTVLWLAAPEAVHPSNLHPDDAPTADSPTKAMIRMIHQMRDH